MRISQARVSLRQMTTQMKENVLVQAARRRNGARNELEHGKRGVSRQISKRWKIFTFATG